MSFTFKILKKIFDINIFELPEKIKVAFNHYILNYPTLVVLQTVSACNLKCEHCFINNYGKDISLGKYKIMKYSEFEQVLPNIESALKKAKYFQITTFEPALQKDIFRIFDKALEINPKLQFPILTNAMLIDEEFLLKLKKYPISEFTVSLDGCKKETVENFKTGANFEKIINVIKTYNKLNFKFPVSVVFVLHKNNYKELPDYVDFVKTLNVKNIYVNNLLVFSEELKDSYVYIENNNPVLDAIFDEAVKRVINNKQVIYLPSTTPVQLGCKSCELLFIDINGNVAPCDYIAVDTSFYYLNQVQKSEPVIFGNIKNQTALNIYKSNEYQQFRVWHRNAKIPEQCKLCVMAYGLVCSNRKKFGKD